MLRHALGSQECRIHLSGIAGLTCTLCLLLGHSGVPATTTRATAAAALTQPARAASSQRQWPDALSVAAWDVPQLVQDSLPSILKVLEAAVRYYASIAPAAALDTDGQAESATDSVADLLSSLTLLTYSASSSAGHDSCPLLHRLYSLLGSVLKLGIVYRKLGVQNNDILFAADKSRMCVGGACLSVLRSSAQELQTTATLNAGGGSSSSRSSSTTTAAAGDRQLPDGVRSISHVLPCLALWGRCFLTMAEQVHIRAAALPDALCAELLVPSLTGDLHPLKTWLAADGVAEQLSAAGYQPQELLQAMQQYQDALDNVTFAEACGEPRPLAPLKQEMTAVGQLYSSVAVPKMICNHPGCSNVAGPSESGIVSGRSCICSGCHTARYCSKLCQRAHWQAHKPVCKALAAAAAAAPAGTSAATTSS